MDKQGKEEPASTGEARHLAHDVLQSIGIIQTVAATVRTEHPANPLLARLAVIEREAQTVAIMCERQLVDRRPPGTPVDVAALVQRVADRMQPTHPGTIDVDAEPCHIIGDEVEWEQALVNLIENACRAAGPDGKVGLVARRAGPFVRVQVGDSGPGFGEVSAGRASVGLIVVSRLVDSHGGHLEVRRSSLGGAELTIVVPAGQAPEET